MRRKLIKKYSSGGNLFGDGGQMNTNDDTITLIPTDNNRVKVNQSNLIFDPNTGLHNVYTDQGNFYGTAELGLPEASVMTPKQSDLERFLNLLFQAAHEGFTPAAWKEELNRRNEERLRNTPINIRGEKGLQPVFGPTEAAVALPIAATTGALSTLPSIGKEALQGLERSMTPSMWGDAFEITTAPWVSSYVDPIIPAAFATHGAYGLYDKTTNGTLLDDPIDTAWNTLEVLPAVGPIAKGVNTVAREGRNAIKQGLNYEFPYVLKPEYNDFSFIRQVGDDAIADMKATGQMRTSSTIFDELYQKLVDEVGLTKADEIAFPEIFDLNANTVYNGFDFSPKTFNRNMFYTGRPFYGPRRTNYIITEPRPITKQKELTNKGLEWIEDGHKGHTALAKRAAREAGLNPDEAIGRIVDPVYNGDTNIIPISELGPFNLYEPVDLFGIKMPWYKRTRYNAVSDTVSNVGEGTVLKPKGNFGTSSPKVKIIWQWRKD